MSIINGAVLITGATGYIASHIIDQLLQAGWDVHATVRSLINGRKVKSIQALAEREGVKGTLKLFEANLLKPGSFKEAMEGCKYVIHTASPCPLPFEANDAENTILKPALEGTRNVLETVNQTPSVVRVVVTSSEAACRGSSLEVSRLPDATIRESDWNETGTLDYLPYGYCKAKSEKEAWKLAEAQDRWKLVTILPTVTVGPITTPDSSSASLNALGRMLKGEFMMGAIELPFAVVDVRDVALAHIRALERDEAHGRYLLAASKSLPWLEMAQMIRPYHPSPWKLPTWNSPAFVLRLTRGLYGMSQRFLDEHLNIHYALDGSRATKDLGITYRPVEESMADYAKSWVELQRA